MLEIMPESRGKIIWARGRDKLTDRDYREVFLPKLEEVLKEHGKARLLFEAAPDFAGWSAGALWEDLKLGLRHKDDFERLVVVAVPQWAKVLTNLFAHFMQGEVRTMVQGQIVQAWEWIQIEPDLTPPGFPEAESW
jgi:hypothetical protein